jgi:SNF2 family DNA or RNA helicase
VLTFDNAAAISRCHRIGQRKARVCV